MSNCWIFWQFTLYLGDVVWIWFLSRIAFIQLDIKDDGKASIDYFLAWSEIWISAQVPIIYLYLDSYHEVTDNMWADQL